MPRQKPEIALGLAISGATLAPGQTRTIAEIAAYCGCSFQAIQNIERLALRKLRSRFAQHEISHLDILPTISRNYPAPTAINE